MYNVIDVDPKPPCLALHMYLCIYTRWRRNLKSSLALEPGSSSRPKHLDPSRAMTMHMRQYYSEAPLVSGHLQNHSQNQQMWAFSKIENKYFLMSIAYYIYQSSKFHLEKSLLMFQPVDHYRLIAIVFKVRIVVGNSYPHTNFAKTTPKFPKVEIQPIFVLNINTLVLIGTMIQFSNM